MGGKDTLVKNGIKPAKSLHGWVLIFYGLTVEYSSDDLFEFLGGIGKINQVVFSLDRASGKPSYHAFVEFDEKKSAIEARNFCTKNKFLGLELIADWAFLTHTRD